MKLIKINKARYRKHLNIVIVASIIVLAVGSLSISQFLIAVFPDPDGSHFHWNLLGVILTSLAIGMVFNQIKLHPFMTEVYYVWQLKQVLNKITRKMRELESASQNGDINAIQIIHYSYAGSRLLWQLDDNNIVIEELAINQAKLENLADKYNVELDTEQFDLEVLKNY